MPNRLSLSLLATVLLTGIMAPAWAQQGGGDKAAEKPQVQPPTAAATSAPEPTGPAPREDTGESADSAFDYESSEKISEDLSVSFPVDI